MSLVFVFIGGVLIGFAVSGLFCYRIVHEGKKHLLSMLELTYSRLAFLYTQICLLEKIGPIVIKDEKENIRTVLKQMEKDITEWKK